MINVACVGVGYWGKNLLRNFHDLADAKLVYCCDLNSDNLQKAKHQFPDVEITANFAQVIESEDVDAVVIASNAIMHYDMAKKALLAGKHVFVEKPMTLKVCEAEQLVKISKEAKKILMVGHLLEYHPAVLKLKELIDAGELGEILYIYSQRLNLGKVRRDENAMWSLAPHDISIILFLLGQEPCAVSAFGGKYLQDNVEDFCYINLCFSDDKKANIHVSWLDPSKVRRTTVIGSKKMAVFDDASVNKLKIFNKSVSLDSLKIDLIDEGYVEPEIDLSEPLKAECQHFLDCIKYNKTPRSNGGDGLRVIRVLEAGQMSLDSGGKIIKLV